MKVVRVTKTEFELEDGSVYEYPVELDEAPSLEDFQAIYDEWVEKFQEMFEDNSEAVIERLGMTADKRLSEIQDARRIFDSAHVKRGVMHIKTPEQWHEIDIQVLKGVYLRCDNPQASLLVAVPANGDVMLYTIRVEDFKRCDLQVLIKEAYI